ncbi:MAG: putative sugar nucleotidyl transferase [Bacteroidota bacterium]
MTLCLFEDDTVARLAPLVLTRAVYDLPPGVLTNRDRAERLFEPDQIAVHVRESILGMELEANPQFLRLGGVTGEVLFVNGRWRVSPRVAHQVREGMSSEPRAWTQGNDLLALWLPAPPEDLADPLSFPEGTEQIQVNGETVISRLWHLLDDVPERIAEDLRAIGGLGEHRGEVQTGAILAHPGRIHIGKGATVRPGAVLNAEDGPIWIGSDAIVEENAVVRGPVYVGERAVIKAGARVDGSSIGYRSKVGGEIHASIVHSLSNKGHDGYLGNSYLGQWCNLGADTNTSNLRNDYGEVSLWDPVEQDFVGTGSQFIGLVMGDHSKCAIDTTFNTGTVVGVSCNLYGAGFHSRHVPSFTWGTPDKQVEYRPEKALRVAEAVMARRQRSLTDAVRENLLQIHAGR